MSLLNAIKAFVNPPDDGEFGQRESNSNTDNKPVTKTGGSNGDTSADTTESVPDTTDSEVDDELQEYASENEDADAPKTPDSQDTSVQPKSQVEGEYWPYMFQPTDKTLISDYEISQAGHPITENGVDTDEDEVYMGEWPRSMVETRQHRDKPTTWIGYQDDPIKKVDAGGIAHEYLFRHSTIFGETGQGKTTLLMNMMLQWINAGYGTCFIDPKGAGDAKELIQRIPNRRLDDVIWIEPGSQREKMIGFNLLETDSEPGDEEWHSEVQELVEQFTEVIKNTENSDGAIINEVTEEVTRYLVRQEYNYNVLDLYTILFNEDDRKKLPELETDQFGKQALQSVANKEEDQLESIKRRVRPWVTDVTTRKILDIRDTGVNLTKAIEDGKILIVKTDNIPDESVTQMFVTAMVRRIWSTIKRRNINEGNFDPYFLVVDEFDKVAVDRLGIGEILSEARAFKFSITLATQQPSSLDKDVQQGVFKNSKNIFTFSPGSHEDARTLSAELGDEIDATALKNLGKYRIAGQIMADGQPNPVILDAFPPYPPLHTKSKAEEIIQKSLDRYGKKQGSKSWDDDSEVFEEYGIVDEDEKKKDENQLQINSDVSIPIDEFLRAIFLAQVKKPTRTFDGKDYVSTDDLKDLLEKRYSTTLNSNFHNSVNEKISDELLDRKMDNDVYARLTDKGKAKSFRQDTGQGGSAGKSAHRRLLALAWKDFTRLGYDMNLPNQEEWDGEDPPDGVATPPILPFEDADNPAEFEELQTTLQSEYPQLYDLFESSVVSVEAESTTLQKPFQTVKNLAKAINRDQKCALVVKEKADGSYEEDPYEKNSPEQVLEKNAQRVYNIFQNPPFVSGMDDDGNRKFYTQSTNLNLKGGGVALRKDDGSHTVWVEDGNKVILKNDDDDEDTVAFRDGEKILNEPLPSNFNYYYEKDKRSNLVVVKNSKQEVIAEYDTVKQMENDGWAKIKPPAIPEFFFDANDDGWMPPAEDWVIMAKPRAINPEYDDESLYIYNPDPDPGEDKFEPLITDGGQSGDDGEDENTISPPTIGGNQDDSPTETPQKDEETETSTSPTSETDAETSSQTVEQDEQEQDKDDTSSDSKPDSEKDDDANDIDNDADWVDSYQGGDDTDAMNTSDDATETVKPTDDDPDDNNSPKPTSAETMTDSTDDETNNDTSQETTSTKPTTGRPTTDDNTDDVAENQSEKPTTEKPSTSTTKSTAEEETLEEKQDEEEQTAVPPTESDEQDKQEDTDETIPPDEDKPTKESESDETTDESEDDDEWDDFTDSSIDI